MAATPYRAVSFEQDDILDEDSLDQLQANYQWIKDNTPRGRFFAASGRPSDTNILMVGGKTRIKHNRKSDSGKSVVRFGNAFASTSLPHVTTAIIATFQRKIHCTLGGIGKATYPNASGFEVYINIDAEKAKHDKMDKDVWVSWIAVGQRSGT